MLRQSFTAERTRINAPTAKNPCPADGRTRREDVKQFIRASRAQFPGIRESLFSAVTGLFDKETSHE